MTHENENPPRATKSTTERLSEELAALLPSVRITHESGGRVRVSVNQGAHKVSCSFGSEAELLRNGLPRASRYEFFLTSLHADGES